MRDAIRGVLASHLATNPRMVLAFSSVSQMGVIAAVFGMGLGPLTVGLLSDRFAVTLGEGPGLRMAMAVCSAAGLVSAGCFMMARRTMRAEIIS